MLDHPSRGDPPKRLTAPAPGGVCATLARMDALDDPFALAEITFWLMGGLEDRSLLHVALAAPPILLGCLVLLRLGPALDALTLGEDTAASLGQPPMRYGTCQRL